MILLFSTLALAAEPRSLALDEAMRLVVERNPDHESAALGEAIADIDRRRARLDRFTATVTANAAGDAGVVVPFDADPYTGTDASWDARATVGLPLYAGGAIRANIDSADASARMAQLDRVVTDRALVRAAYTAYWTIKGYELQIAATEEGLALTEESLAIITAKADAGLAAGIDVNRAKVDLYSQQATLVEARAARTSAEQELVRLLHLGDTSLTLTDEPPVPATGAVALAADAGTARPELARHAAESDAADAAIRAAKSGALPSVTLSGTAGVGNSTTAVNEAIDAGDLAPQLDASVGVTFSWNPFDLFRVRDEVAQARLAARQVDAATEAERASIAADLREAQARVEALRAQVPLTDAQVGLARDNLQIVQGLYGQGSATILDLFDAQSAFRSARTQGATLRVDLATAEYDLRWLLGEDLASGASR